MEVLPLVMVSGSSLPMPTPQKCGVRVIVRKTPLPTPTGNGKGVGGGIGDKPLDMGRVTAPCLAGPDNLGVGLKWDPYIGHTSSGQCGLRLIV